MKKIWMQLLPIPILLFGAVVAWNIANSRSTPPISEIPSVLRTVEVIALSPEDVAVTIRSHGVVKPRVEIDLVSQTAGLISTVSDQFVVGGHFEKAQTLLRIDPADAQIALLSAQAHLDQIDTELQLEQLKLHRVRELIGRGFANPAQLQEAEFKHRINLARKAGANASLKAAQRELEQTVIRAPFAGKMHSKLADVGQFIQRGTIVGRIYATDALEVRLPISTSDLRFITLPNNDPEVGTTGSRVQLYANSIDRETNWNGQVVRVEGALSEPGRMLHVVVRLDDSARSQSQPTVLPNNPMIGRFVEAVITGKKLKGLFVLPRSALANGSNLLVVDRNGRLEKVSVEIVRMEDDQVLVNGGVVAGNRVVVSALGLLAGTRAHFVPVSRGEES